MIRDLSQVLLDVESVEASAKFWEEYFGFTVVNTMTSSEGAEIVELGAHLDAETTLVLQTNVESARHVTDRPSLVFSTYRFDELYEALAKSIEVGPIEELYGLRTFTFKDLDSHVFLIKEASQLQFD